MPGKSRIVTFYEIFQRDSYEGFDRAKESLNLFQPGRDNDRRRDIAPCMSTTIAQPPNLSQYPRSQVDRLICARCCGRRSPFYHRQHLENPAEFPAIGICSRRRTLCAASKDRSRTSCNTLPVIHELAADITVDRGCVYCQVLALRGHLSTYNGIYRLPPPYESTGP